MKKLCFCGLFLAILLLLGCDPASYSVILTNETAGTVEYEFDGAQGKLGPSQSTTRVVGAWTRPPSNVVDGNGIASVRVRTDGVSGNHFFERSEKIDLEVMNTLAIPLTIKAGNFIDNEGKPELKVEAGKTATAVIYKPTPDFTADSDFPIKFDVSVLDKKDDDDNVLGKKMSVMVR